MLELIVSFIFFLLAFAGMSFGRLFGRRGICGSCGGLGEDAGSAEGTCPVRSCPVMSPKR